MDDQVTPSSFYTLKAPDFHFMKQKLLRAIFSEVTLHCNSSPYFWDGPSGSVRS